MYRVFVLSVGLTFLLLSCEKDDLPRNSHRIIQESGEQSKTLYTYEGEKLVRTESYSLNDDSSWKLYSEVKINYKDNLAIWITSHPNQDPEPELVPYMKTEYTIEDDQVSIKKLFTYSGTGWIEYLSYYYQYLGGKLSSFTRSSPGEFLSSGEFRYSSGLLVEFLEESTNSGDHMAKYYYSGEKLDSCYKSYRYDSEVWSETERIYYYYEGESVISIEEYRRFEDDEVFTLTTTNLYEYDTHGNLSGIVSDGYPGNYTFDYEAGHGNLSTFLDKEILIEDYAYPQIR